MIKTNFLERYDIQLIIDPDEPTSEVTIRKNASVKTLLELIKKLGRK